MEDKDRIGGEVEEGIGTLEGNILKAKSKTEFIFCSQCVPRKPGYVITQYYCGYCPGYGIKSDKEGILNFTTKYNNKA